MTEPTNSLKPTPRCDALDKDRFDSNDNRAWASLARKLERELTALTAAAQKARSALEQFVLAEDEWRQQKGGMPEGTFDDTLSGAYNAAKAALASLDRVLGEPK